MLQCDMDREMQGISSEPLNKTVKVLGTVGGSCQPSLGRRYTGSHCGYPFGASQRRITSVLCPRTTALCTLMPIISWLDIACRRGTSMYTKLPISASCAELSYRAFQVLRSKVRIAQSHLQISMAQQFADSV